MQTTLISQFIDDELSLSEKSDFIRWLQEDAKRMNEMLEFLKQEMVLRTPLRLDRQMPPLTDLRSKRSWLDWFRWKHLVPVAAAIALLIGIWYRPIPLPNGPSVSVPVSHRFVIYAPEGRQVEIAGTFSDWRPVPMHRIGAHGYWELVLPMQPGEYRYTIMIDRNIRMPDPTVPLREADDFGTTNSILRIG